MTSKDFSYLAVSELRAIRKALVEGLALIARQSREDVANPVITLAGTTVTITCATANAAIHYTTDGSEPTEESPTYSTGITISAKTTVKAISVLLNKNNGYAEKECTPAAATE